MTMARYLSGGLLVSVTSPVHFPCLLCGEVIPDSATYLTDEVWLWHGLCPHYLLEHRIRLPKPFEEHIRASIAAKRPMPTRVVWDALPWPPFSAE